MLQSESVFSSYGVKQTSCGNLLRAGEVPGEGQWVGALVKTAPCTELCDCNPLSLRPLWSGPPSPERKGKDLVPHADEALSIFFDKKQYPCADLDLPAALHFLHRDSIVLPDAPLGYNVVTYKGHPLGFVKNLGKRCNNLHPAGRRILKDV